MDDVEVVPATVGRWGDVAGIAGEGGLGGGCWCQWWRLPNAEWHASSDDDRRLLLRAAVEEGEGEDRRPPGLVALRGGQPVGWVSVAPRDAYPRLDRTQATPRVDDRPVWSVVCFVVAPQHRGAGVAAALLDAAVAQARAAGAEVLEAYPVDPGGRRLAPSKAAAGPLALYLAAGFVEVARTRGRPTLRLGLR